MTQKEIEDGNRLIAEFMNINDWFSYEDARMYSVIENQLPPYHLDFSWIISVIDKIESTAPNRVEICLHSCKIVANRTFKVEGAESKIIAVWSAVVQYITWLNKQK